MEEVILVDEKDIPLGVMEKMEAHEKGVLHRAFSVFIFNSNKELLVQRRALSKYHSAGLWSNTCCSHPRPGEDTLRAAKRRLREEMGLELELHYETSFIYKTPFENGLTEHEFDHVYFGYTDKQPIINSVEVDSYRWQTLFSLKEDILKKPGEFTSWFKIVLEKVL